MAGDQTAQVVHGQRMQAFARSTQPGVEMGACRQVPALQERSTVERRRFAPQRFIGAAYGRKKACDIDVDASACGRPVEADAIGFDAQAVTQPALAQRAQRVQGLAKALAAGSLGRTVPQ